MKYTIIIFSGFLFIAFLFIFVCNLFINSEGWIEVNNGKRRSRYNVQPSLHLPVIEKICSLIILARGNQLSKSDLNKLEVAYEQYIASASYNNFKSIEYHFVYIENGALRYKFQGCWDGYVVVAEWAKGDGNVEIKRLGVSSRVWENLKKSNPKIVASAGEHKMGMMPPGDPAMRCNLGFFDRKDIEVDPLENYFIKSIDDRLKIRK